MILEAYRTYFLFNSYKVTNKQSCNKINRRFTCIPDREGMAEAEESFKEEEEAEVAQTVEVVEEVEKGYIKEEPRLDKKSGCDEKYL